MNAELFNVVDVLIGFVSGALVIVVAHWILEKIKLRNERIRLAKSLITELKGFYEAFSHFEREELLLIEKTPIFDALLPKILLFKEETIETVLTTYSKIMSAQKPLTGISSQVSEEIKNSINKTIALLEKEMN